MNKEINNKADNLNVFRLLRIARDKKVKELADELLVTPAYINAIENGEKYPSRRLLRDYAKALGVDENTIIAFQESKNDSDGSVKNVDSSVNLRFERALLSLLNLICKTE